MGKKVLVVDDEPNIVQVVISRLKANNYDVITAVDGQEALELAQREKPDLIILDLMLPKLDGYKVCSILKSNDQHKDTPIIMLTARGEIDDMKNGLEKGANAYVTKPFNSNALIGIIDGLIGK